MFDHAPGSQRWWLETVAIAFGGIALAVWLWDAPLGRDVPAQEIAADPQPRTFGELLDAGCLTQANLQAMREGRRPNITCPAPFSRNIRPPDPRPFP